MPRHARNSTAGTVYTYHEKKKDSKQCGYGTVEMRLAKDSIKPFDCCCLTLQPCDKPVVTSDGYLYDKEAIIKCMLEQKREFARKMKAYENEKLKKVKEAEREEQAKKEELIKKFFDNNPSSSSSSSPKTDCDSISNMANGRDKELPSFWLPSLTPSSKPTELTKPDEVVRCPMSGRPLKLKDLTEVKFTPINDADDSRSLIAKEVRYVCPVTNDILGNSIPCAVLRTSGSVVTLECIEKVIRKDMIDPTNGKKMKEKDIIMLQRGSVGFAASGVDLKASKEGAVMTA